VFGQNVTNTSPSTILCKQFCAIAGLIHQIFTLESARARTGGGDHEGMAALRWVTLPGIDESMVPPPGRSLPITGRTGRKLLLLRTHRGELSCLDASCFHQGEDLSHGEILDIEALGTVVQCPRHGAGRRDQTLGLITTSILEPLPTPRAACAVCLQAAAWML
jgi:hypothetical protein